MLFDQQDFQIYFGDATDNIFPKEKKVSEALSLVQKRIGAQGLFLLRQVHGTDGVYAGNPFVFKHPGDFIITNTPGLGIGVVTADCLPIVLCDAEHHACAVIHAGWRGAVNGIVARAVDMMRAQFYTKPENIQAYFGPSAQRCCYAVSDDFYKNVPKHTDQVLVPLQTRSTSEHPEQTVHTHSITHSVLHSGRTVTSKDQGDVSGGALAKTERRKGEQPVRTHSITHSVLHSGRTDGEIQPVRTERNGVESNVSERGLYFDNVLLNTLFLQECGVLEKNICTKNNVCTICDTRYWSYRRQGDAAGRNVTIVMLRR